MSASANDVTTAELRGFSYVHVPGSKEQSLFLLHGTGADEYDLLGLGSHLAPDASIISARGRSPEGSVNRWFARFGPGVLDEEDIVKRAAELSEFVPAAAQAHEVNPSGIWAVGFSNGANMAAAMLLLHPDIFAGAVLLRPMLPLEPEAMPELTRKPVYVASGTRDTMIPRASTDRLLELLESSGADVTVRWQEAGHGLGPDELPPIVEWLGARIA